jgi:predicted permease
VVLDARVLFFALGASVLTGIVFGILPALQLRVANLAALVKEGARRASSGIAGLASRRTLVVVEMALAVGLVVGSGLMLRSLDRLLRVDKGFVSEGLITFGVFLPQPDYPDSVAQQAFFDRLFERVRGMAEVQSVAAASGLPPVRDVNANDMEIEGFVPTDDGPAQNVDYWQFATVDYLQTMGTRVLEGRGFEARDGAESSPVVLVNQRLVEVFYPDESPLGRRLRPGFGAPEGQEFPWFTIVGVVEDVKQGGLAESTGTEVYWSFEQVGALLGLTPRTMSVVARARIEGGERGVERVANALQEAVWEIDRSLPVADLRTMDQVVSGSVARSRFVTLLLSVFGVLALILAAIGIYGVMSYAVTEQGREIAIRSALGAQRRTILGAVLRQGMWVAALGLAVGVVATLGLSRFLRSMLFEVEASDPSTYVVVLALLTGVALLACLVPALRATRVDPIKVLRSE